MQMGKWRLEGGSDPPRDRGHPGCPEAPARLGQTGLSLVLSDVFRMLVNIMALKRPPPLFILPPRAGWKQSGA